LESGRPERRNRFTSAWILARTLVQLLGALRDFPSRGQELRNTIIASIELLLRELADLAQSAESDEERRILENSVMLVVVALINIQSGCAAKSRIVEETSKYMGKRRASNTFSRLDRANVFVLDADNCYRVRWL